MIFDWIALHLWLARTVWVGSGIIGLRLLIHIRRSHYEQRSDLWWLCCITIVVATGPFLMLCYFVAAIGDKFIKIKK